VTFPQRAREDAGRPADPGADGGTCVHFGNPGCAHAEKRGTFTNVQGRVQSFLKAGEPAGLGFLPDLGSRHHLRCQVSRLSA
jgi:hypothetical protein